MSWRNLQPCALIVTMDVVVTMLRKQNHPPAEAGALFTDPESVEG